MEIISVPPPLETTNPEIVSLRAQVQAAQEEFELVVRFHEVWKPAAYDKDLHQRMGVSYATNAFRVVVTALRREMRLALMRLWDKGKGNVRLDDIGRRLSDRHLVDALAAGRAARFHDANVEAAGRASRCGRDLVPSAAASIAPDPARPCARHRARALASRRRCRRCPRRDCSPPRSWLLRRGRGRSYRLGLDPAGPAYLAGSGRNRGS